MKTGRTLAGLVAELERQRETKHDYGADTRLLEMTSSQEQGTRIGLRDVGDFGITSTGHRQIGSHVEIPAPYYDRMLNQAPALLADNVNHWLHEKPEKRMVRTLDGKVRALLSTSFRALDNFDLAEVAVPALIEAKVEVVSCEVTESRLYIKAVDPRAIRRIDAQRMIDGKLVAFDEVCPTVTVSNSEIGHGSLSIEVGMFSHGCKNMMMFREHSMRKYHVGARADLSDEVVALLSDDTKRLTDRAVWSQFRDVMSKAFDGVEFTKRVERVSATTADRITGDPGKVIEVTAKRLGLGEEERKSVLRHLIEGGNLTRYGLLNAVTRSAEDAVSYDRATELERLGGQIVELTANDWQQLSVAA